MVEAYNSFMQWARDAFVVDIATLLGLAVAIWGIAATLGQARKASTSAEAAAVAVREMRYEISKVNVVADLTAALAIVDEMKRLQRVQQWALLPDRYSQLRTLLISLHVTYPNFSAEERAALVLVTQQLRIAEERIEAALARSVGSGPQQVASVSTLDWAQLNKTLNNQMGRLQELLAVVRTRIGVP